MNCPNCNHIMKSRPLGLTQVDECPNCSGIWFEKGELQEAQAVMDEDTRWMDFDLWQDQQLFRVKQGSRHCPVCQVALAVVEYGDTGVMVDACPNYHGVFLDHGELSGIVGSLEEELSEKTSDEYFHEALHEARELLTGEKGLIAEWRDLGTVLRLLQYRILVENPGVRQALIALQRSSPFQ